MAFPVVEATVTTDHAASLSHTVNLPAGIQAGETLLVIGARSSASTWPGDWTEILDEAVARGFCMAYKKASGSEGSTIGVTLATSVAAGWIAFRISGTSDATTRPPEIGVTATGGTGGPNPPSLTPTGGAKDYLWIAAYTKNDIDVNAAPTNYVDRIEREYSGSSVSLGTATRNLNAATEDPGAFGFTNNTAWRAQTIAIHPAPPSGPIVQTLPSLTQSAAATAGPNTGPVAQTLPGLTQSSAATTGPNTGPIAQTLPALTQSAEGTATSEPNTGPIAQTLPGLTQSAEGTVPEPVTGPIVQTLPALTQSVEGTVPEPVTGAVAQTLPALTQSIVVTTAIPLSDVAAYSRLWTTSRAVKVGERWDISEETALDWIRQAQEAGYNVGMPRDKGERDGDRYH